jgi:transcriptional regulator GlxA family with amidase domain
VDRIFINDGPIWTSAGMSAGIDLALALIEADLGQQVAQAVARKLVLYHRRAGANRSSRLCSNLNRSRIVSNPRSPTPSKTSIVR